MSIFTSCPFVFLTPTSYGITTPLQTLGLKDMFSKMCLDYNGPKGGCVISKCLGLLFPSLFSMGLVILWIKYHPTGLVELCYQLSSVLFLQNHQLNCGILCQFVCFLFSKRSWGILILWSCFTNDVIPFSHCSENFLDWLKYQCSRTLQHKWQTQH